MTSVPPIGGPALTPVTAVTRLGHRAAGQGPGEKLPTWNEEVGRLLQKLLPGIDPALLKDTFEAAQRNADEARQQVEQAAKQLGLRPHELRRALVQVAQAQHGQRQPALHHAPQPPIPLRPQTSAAPTAAAQAYAAAARPTTDTGPPGPKVEAVA